MRIFAVVAERFPVVRGDDDDRGIEKRLAGQRAQQPRDKAIDRCDLAVVGRRREPFLQVGRRIVRVVRVEEMRPQKKRLRSS